MTVAIDTTALARAAVGQFSLVLALTDGVGRGDGNNRAILRSFSLGGGNPSGIPTRIGGASGSLATGVGLTTTSFFNALIEPFTPGAFITFDLEMTELNDDGGVADRLQIGLLDPQGNPLKTFAPIGNYLLGVDFFPANAPAQLFSGNPILAPQGARSSPVSVSYSSSGTLPIIAANGVVPIYSTSTSIQPGSWISVYGTGLAPGAAIWKGDFPVSLGGVSVTINGKLGYLWSVSAGQINLQAPDESSAGPVNVVVSTASAASATAATLAAASPSFNLLPDGKHAAAQSPSRGGGSGLDVVGLPGTFSFPTRAVRQGEILVLYGTGFGPTEPTVAAGSSFLGVARTQNPIQITIGGVVAPVAFSGLIAPGLYQINLVVPNCGSGEKLILGVASGVPTAIAPIVSVE